MIEFEFSSHDDCFLTTNFISRINQSPTSKFMMYLIVVYLESKSRMIAITSFTPY